MRQSSPVAAMETSIEIPVPAHQDEAQTGAVVKPEPLYNVVLLDDDDHTYEYVIEMLCAIFGHSVDDAFQMAREVDLEGRVIVDTTHRERAELKRDQILGFGADPLLRGSRGSMRATIEPTFG